MDEQSKFFNSVRGAFNSPEAVDPQAEAMKQKIKQDALSKLQGQPPAQSIPVQPIVPQEQSTSLPLQQSLINYFKNRQNGQ